MKLGATVSRKFLRFLEESAKFRNPSEYELNQTCVDTQ